MDSDLVTLPCGLIIAESTSNTTQTRGWLVVCGRKREWFTTEGRWRKCVPEESGVRDDRLYFHPTREAAEEAAAAAMLLEGG